MNEEEFLRRRTESELEELKGYSEVKEHLLLFSCYNSIFCHLKKAWQKNSSTEYVILIFLRFLIRNGKKERIVS